MSVAPAQHVSVGWDVGAWHCGPRSKSRDAVAILDSRRALVGRRWRGNLRSTIAVAANREEFVAALFRLCGESAPAGDEWTVTMAIDAPLGFSEEFVDLLKGKRSADPGERRPENWYLFRQTERHHFERGKRPMSAVQDMIGSQATKAMHALAKFAPTVESCGVWTDGRGFRAIETYPAVCMATPIGSWLDADCDLKHKDDRRDALICALVAHLFSTNRASLQGPDRNTPASEGWIWYPRGGGRVA